MGIFLGIGGAAHAADVRLALLVGHARGWQGDQPLRYTLQGDLKPMSKAFQSLGFQVTVASNPTPQRLRALMAEIAKRVSANRATTFFFYYTGHADRDYLHLGKKGKQPFHYRELIRFLLRLPVKRRFALLDACFSSRLLHYLPKQKVRGQRSKGKWKRPSLRRMLLQEVNRKLKKSERFVHLHQLQRWFHRDRGKGVKRRKKVNTANIPTLSRKQEAGLQIIASSQGLSWERPDYRSSVFTFHWLRGLRGPADQNLDGKITIDELYQFVRTRVRSDAGQKTDRFVLFRGSYVMAPHYRSRLYLNSRITGKFKISVENFVWTYDKRHKRAIRLPVVHGAGQVEWRHKGACWTQRLTFPKFREARLSSKWKRDVCRRFAMVRKGSIVLNGREELNESWRSLSSRLHSLAISAGGGMMGGGSLQAPLWNAELSYRYHFMGVGLHVSQTLPADKSFSVYRALVQPEVGYPLSLGDFRFFFGLMPHIGVAFVPGFGEALSIGAAARIDVSWWMSKNFGLRFGGILGFDYSRIAGEPLEGLGMRWQLGLAGVFDLAPGR